MSFLRYSTSATTTKRCSRLFSRLVVPTSSSSSSSSTSSSLFKPTYSNTIFTNSGCNNTISNSSLFNQFKYDSINKRLYHSYREKILDQGDKNPHDASEQEKVYKELIDMSDYETVITRFESMGYASNEECIRYYFKALVFSKQLDRAYISTSKVSQDDKLKHMEHLKNKFNQQPSQDQHGTQQHDNTTTSGDPIITLPPYNISFILPDEVIQKINQKPIIPILRMGDFTTMRMSMIDRLVSLLWVPIVLGGIFLLMVDGNETASSVVGGGSVTTSGSSKSKGKSVAKEYTDTPNVTTFEDVKGIEEVKSELIEIVDYLKYPEKYDRIGAKLPKGILLSGEPGTGKTLLARAIAGEADVPFLYTTGSSFDEKYVGVGAKRVRELFDLARSLQPCIIFIDEIDAVGKTRVTTHFNETLLQLLSEMDGFDQHNRIMVIGATNSPETLDTALTRPGRFDRQIAVPIPDLRGRKEIVEFYLSKVAHDENEIKADKIARSVPGFTGADISNLINTAAIKAVLNGQEKVTLKLIDESRDDILMGRARKSSIMSEETRKNTAYHEAGHALVAAFTDSADPIHKATIIQRGHALGMVSQLPESDHLQYTRKQMMARLAICLAGRASEEIFFGHDNVTSGASSDFQQASKLATAMVTKWGMSDKLGFTFHVDEKMSQDTKSIIDLEIKNLLDKQYEYAKSLIIKHKDKMHLLVNELIDKETLTGEEILQILDVPPQKEKVSSATPQHF